MPFGKRDSGLKLSSVTQQGRIESLRKQKLSKLSPIHLKMVNAKQKDMDAVRLNMRLSCDAD